MSAISDLVDKLDQMIIRDTLTNQMASIAVSTPTGTETQLSSEEKAFFASFMNAHPEQTYDQMVNSGSVLECQNEFMDRFDRVITDGAFNNLVKESKRNSPKKQTINVPRNIKVSGLTEEEKEYLMNVYMGLREIPFWQLLAGEQYEPPFESIAEEFNKKFQRDFSASKIQNYIKIYYDQFPVPGAAKTHSMCYNPRDEECEERDDDTYSSRYGSYGRHEPDDIYQ